MARIAQQILDDALQLVPDERDWLAEQLLIGVNEEAFSALKKEYGEPEPGYEEWFRTGVEEALADNSEGIPYEEAVERLDRLIGRNRQNTDRATILP
jgi:hypothetical protein